MPDGRDWRRLYRYWLRDPVVGARLLALHQVMRALPTDAVAALGGRLGLFAGPRLHSSADRRARATLALLRPELAADAGAATAFVSRMWQALGQVYAEFSAEDRLWPEGRVAVQGTEHARKRAKGERPLIVAGVHLANWELLPIALGYLGHDVTDIYQPQRNRFEDGIAVHTRQRAERRIRAAMHSTNRLHLVPPSPTAGAELLQALRAHHALMIYVDEHVGGRVHAPSFGRPLRTDGNLARAVRLARMADADIVPAYVERVSRARYVAHFLPPLALQRTADRAADIQANVAALDGAVTGPVLAHLDQWFMLPDFRMDR